MKNKISGASASKIGLVKYKVVNSGKDSYAPISDKENEHHPRAYIEKKIKFPISKNYLKNLCAL